jgi:hypothetical protein
MKKLFTYIIVICVSLVSQTFAQEKPEKNLLPGPDCSCTDSLVQPSDAPLSGGLKVLETGRKMAIIDKTIVRGSCWDFVNEVFKQAGVSSNKAVVFRSKKGGPYAKADMVKPGDWIYHVNHNFNNVEHSAIFVCWKDFEKRIAITLSYAGMNKNLPGKYGTYNLKSIYSIFRPIVPTDIKINTENSGN